MIKLLLIDDHQSILDSFSSVIKQNKDIQLVEMLTDASKALSICNKHKIDVVLTDVRTANDESGIEATKQIKKTFPNIRVIVMSGFDEISYIPTAIEAGADAFVSKTRPIQEFVEMIKKVMVGEGSFPHPILIPTIGGQASYSSRELEILRLLCKAYKREEIATELSISVGTVKRHIENMLTKSGCKTTMELAVYVIGKGWIGPK